MFKNTIVRIPCKNFAKGISSANLGIPDYRKALRQHENYVKALEKCGLNVTVLPPLEEYPDSTFVEDVALLTPVCAIITRPAVKSRQGEEDKIQPTISQFYENLHYIRPPGTLEAGDVLQVENHFYVGLSGRTNREGAAQLESILTKFNFTISTIPFQKTLHLKSGVASLDDNKLVVSGEFIDQAQFQAFELIKLPPQESYSANCILVNDYVIIPDGFKSVREKIESSGYKTIEIDVSEFRKMDGGLSCLSLRF